MITQQLLSDLASLADGVLPLQRWIAQKAYDPRQDPTFSGQPMPWREQGEVLTVARTGFEIFFSALLRETSNDVQAGARWRRVAADPLGRNPLQDVAGWRSERGLAEFAAFGIVASQNMLLDSQNQQIARLPFYRDTLPDLAYCLELQRPQHQAGWEALASALFKDQLPAWPGTVHPAIVFMNQFAADVLYAVLGMRNYSAVEGQPAYATAVLTELGQARRRGNKNTPEEAQTAVARFVAQIEKDLKSAVSLSTPSSDRRTAS